MAVKYYSDFSDDDGRDWHIVIHDQDYSGSSPVEFTCSTDGFTLQYEGSDTNRSQSVIPSTLQFGYYIQNGNDDNLLSDIAGSAEGRFQIEVYYGGADYSSGHLYWRGVLLADISEVVDEYYPQEFTLLAIDDLAGLREDDFNTGNSGYSSVAAVVSNALNRMRVWDITSATQRAVAATWYKGKDWNDTYRSAWTNSQLNWALFENTDTFPNTYTKTYEALESILSGLGARIFWRASIDASVDSGFVIDSLNAQQYDTDLLTGVAISNTGTTTSTTLARQEINLDSTGIKRLRGFRKGYLNPLLKAERTFTYGNSPFVVDHEYSGNVDANNFHDGSYDAELHPAPSVEYEDGTPVSLRFTATFNHTEGSTSAQAFDSVPKRAGRFKISAKFKLGQYYADRGLTVQGTTGVYVTDGGGFCDVVTFTEDQSSWSTSSSNRIEWYTPPLVWTDEESLSFQMGVDLSPLPADLTSEDCTIAWTITPVDSDGNTATYLAAIGDLFNADAPDILKATLYPTNIFEIAGSSITFKAENDNTDAREVLRLPSVFFSDQLNGRGGGLFMYANGTRTQPSDWQSSTNSAADLNLHNLVAREWVQGQSRNIKKMSGEVRDSRTSSTKGITLLDTITHSSENYSIHGLSFTAARGIYSLDCVQLENSGTVSNPAEVFEGQFDNSINTGGRPPVTPVTEVGVGVVQEKTDLLTITQAVDLDTLESDVSDNSTNITSITAVLKTALTGDGAGVYADSGKSVTASHMSLTTTTAKMQAGGGNTAIELTETSPGEITLKVQAGSTGNETDITAVAIEGESTSQKANITMREKVTFAAETSGIRYTDLSGTPSIPSTTSDITEGTNLYYTDARADARIAAANVTDLSDVTAAGSGSIITSAERTKLTGIATGATANDSDANLKNRANHTGTQTASTISDFDTEVSNNTAVVANTAKTTFPGFGTTAGTALEGDTTTITTAQANAITANTAKTTFPGFGTTAGTALEGDTALLQLGTTSGTALAGDTTTISTAQANAITANTAKTSFPGFGTTAGTALEGDTSLLQLGTTSSTALAGDTTTITTAQANAITANTAKVSADGLVTTHSDVSSAGSGSIITSSERTKLTGVQTGATANDTDANLKNRSNHTGTQTASTISDFDTEVSNNVSVAANTAKNTYPSADATKLAGIATGATANDTDANLLNRTNHTGTQTASTISDFSTEVDSRISVANVTDLSDVTSAGSGSIITSAERTKLSGIATGAQVNPTDTDDLTEGSSNLYHTNSRVDARIALADLSDLANVNATSPTNGQVLTWDTSASEWTAGDGGGQGGGGSDSFNTIQVSGQSDVVADSGNDTLTLAAGTNLAITTNATTDTITFTPSLTPTFTSATISLLSTSVGIINTGSLTTGGTTVNGTLSSGAITSSGTVQCSGINFAGAGTTTIAPVSSGPAFPDDLQIESNGNVTIVLDDDDNETDQFFKIVNGAGTVIFQVNESGVTSGLLTSATPTISTVSNFESTQTGTITVSNYDSDATYQVKLYNSSGTEQTSQTITDNQDGTWSVTNGPILTSAYVEIQSLEFGKLTSAVAQSNTFNITAAATQQRYWRLQITDSNKNPVASKKIALGEFRLYTQTGGGGTRYPSNMTSATTPSPYVVTRGYQFQSYHAYLAFDSSGSNAGSMWWTLGTHSASNAWIQIDLGSSIDLNGGECKISTSGGWTDANYAVLYGSNTGAFTGEEREMAFFQNIDTPGESGGTFTTFTEAIT